MMEDVIDFDVEGIGMPVLDETTGGWGGIMLPGSPTCMEVEVNDRSHGFGRLSIMGWDGVPSCVHIAQIKLTMHLLPLSDSLHVVRLVQALFPLDPLSLP